MRKLNLPEVESALLPFRKGRRLLLTLLLEDGVLATVVQQPLLMFSRLFCRLKSADSIIESAQRKGIDLDNPAQITQKLNDVLGLRVIVENRAELDATVRMLSDRFELQAMKDLVGTPNEYGGREVRLSLRYNDGEFSCPFEVQARTFLQHYWATKSFHLFHKKPSEVALRHRETLVALGNALEGVEPHVSTLDQTRPNTVFPTSHCSGLAVLTANVHLLVVQPEERLSAHIAVPLTGDDQRDHQTLATRKAELYSANRNHAIVECSCLNLSSFLLNEPHVVVPPDRLAALAF